jgi:hypothetical protein
MNSVNLIPAPRLAARKRRVHLRRCAAACCGWAVASALAAGAAHAMWRPVDDPQSDERLAVVSDDIERTERAIAGVKIRLAAAQSTLRANEAIASQPDWSILLAVLARGIGDDVVLRSCHVHPAGANGGRVDGRRAVAVAPPVAPSPAAPVPAVGVGAGTSATVTAAEEALPFVLEASGVARTLASAHRFVNDLEKTGLFARVSLLDTTRDSVISDGAIAFRIECSLDEPAAPSAPAGGAQAAVDKR